MVPYNDFQLTEKQINTVKKEYAKQKIAKYIKEHGTEPDDLKPFYSVTETQLEAFRMKLYAKQSIDEFEYEQEHGPSEMVETRFSFNNVDDMESPILGFDKLSYKLGASVDDDEYQYEYWNIAVIGGDYPIIGSFSSLREAKVTLNTLKKYDIFVYLRKSKYGYEKTLTSFNIDNEFHQSDMPFGYIKEQPLSDYMVQPKGPKYETQLEDKEYFGMIQKYTPTRNGVVSGSVYTLNPRLQVNVSGLTEGLKCVLHYHSYTPYHSAFGWLSYPTHEGVVVKHEIGQNITFEGDLHNFVQTSDSSFSCYFEKDYLLASFYGLRTEIASYNPNIAAKDFWVGWGGGCLWYGPIDGEANISLPGSSDIKRNEITVKNEIIPPQGEDIDTGFEFDAVDD